MRVFSRALWRLAVVCFVLTAARARAVEERPYQEARYENAELKYIDGLPVLMVAGTPAEIGRQKAALTAEIAQRLLVYPKELLKLFGREDRWSKMVEQGRLLLPQFPADYREELKAFGDKSGMAVEAGIVANTLVDVYRGGFGCSSLLVDAQRSATGGPLFGRNLDFFNLGFLDKYSLVTVHRPQGKHAFVSIGFPGLFGCLSGMNDAGLALAVHEVYLSRDHSPMFNPKGVPYTFCFRRMLEECTTVQEAEQLLRRCERTTRLNLVLCDRQGGAVLEMTPLTVALRRGEDGICACTNHFRTKDLAVLPLCPRYHALMRSSTLATLDVAEVAKKLDEVNQGRLTVQTMIFEPAPLVLHLAIGSCPSSALPLKRLDLAPLLK